MIDNIFTKLAKSIVVKTKPTTVAQDMNKKPDSSKEEGVVQKILPDGCV
jgi:hypothetical protein